MRVPQVSERIKEAPAHALRGVFAGVGQLLLVTDKLRNKTPAGAGVPRTRAPEAAEPAATAPPATAEPGTDSSAASPAADSSPAEVAAAGTAVTGAPSAAAPQTAVVEPVAAKHVAAKRVAAKAAAKPAAAKAAPVKAAPVKAAPVKAATGEPAAAEPAPVTEAAAKPARPATRKSPKKPPARDFDKTGNVRMLAGEEDAEAAASDVPPASADGTPPPLPRYDELSVGSLRARLRNLDLTQLQQVTEYERAHAGRAEVIAMFERRVAKLEAEPQAGT